MRHVWTALAVLVVLSAGSLLYAWSGIYNIAATQPHWDITRWFIETLKDRSIDVHSEDVQVPNLDEATIKQAAFSHYHGMCRLCHGAPGVEPEEFAKGLYPEPPEMTSGHLQQEFNQAQIHWIAKHGIKLTGMPAFGPTHTEEALWGLVALVEEMDDMSPEQYRQQLDQREPDGQNGHQHTH